jgi:hypothetical protein
MWYNRNIPIKNLTKGGIFMPKGKPNKRYTPEFKIKVVETMPPEPQCSEGFVLYLAETAIKNIFRQIQTSA